MSIRFVDLFAGLGGFHVAATAVGAQCVLASEIDDYLRSLYHRNFGIGPVGDVRQIRWSDVPAHDLLCAGFPCQPFSKAGEQAGRRDTGRGRLFDEILVAARTCRPRWVLLENVQNFLYHNGGLNFSKLTAGLNAIGYATSHMILSPHQFGVPQLRPRLYIVGCLQGLDGFEWPRPDTNKEDLDLRAVLDRRPKDARALSADLIDCVELWQEFLNRVPGNSTLPSFPIWAMEHKASYAFDRGSLHDLPLQQLRGMRGVFGTSLRKHRRADILPLVPSYARRQRDCFPDWKQEFIRRNRLFLGQHSAALTSWMAAIQQYPPSLQKLEWNCQGGARDIWKYVIQIRASGVRVKRPSTAPSLVAMTSTQVPIIGWERRYMTTRECARLQALDGLRELPRESKAIRALGNAVCATVAKRIIESLIAAGPRTVARTKKRRVSSSRNQRSPSLSLTR